MDYRPEIDGLRAVAVLPVILFHAGFDLFSGGFVGVDIFFVISGYLITSILIGEIAEQRFSILRFYERRARRILPALLVVILCCLPVAWVLMLPSQMRDFGQSLVAVAFFASNIFFWLESDYFAAAAELKPMLHTWSLAVEEQYYLLFPLLLAALWRYGQRSVLAVIGTLIVASLALSEWGWRSEPVANFYLAPSRIWELLAGSLAAFQVRKSGVKSHEWLSLAGMSAILCAIFLFDRSTPFPSLYAVLPVLGTWLLVTFAGPTTLVARVLSLKWVVGVGLISYSAYLWHQPLFAFYRITSPNAHGDLALSLLSVLALVLAYVSWRFVERPFRDRRRYSARFILGGASASIAGLAVLGLMLPEAHGQKFSAIAYTEELVEQKLAERFDLVRRVCRRSGWETCNDPQDGAVNILVLGDSNAVDGLNILESVTEGVFENIHYPMSTLGGCFPHQNIRAKVGQLYPNLEQCEALNATQRYNPEYLNQHEAIALSLLLGGLYPQPDFETYLRYLSKHYNGDVLVFGSTFRFEDDLPNYLNRGLGADELLQFLKNDPRLNEHSLAALVESLGYTFISKLAPLCAGTPCNLLLENGELLSYDSNHLSLGATQLLGEIHREDIERFVAKLIRDKRPQADR